MHGDSASMASIAPLTLQVTAVVPGSGSDASCSVSTCLVSMRIAWLLGEVSVWVCTSATHWSPTTSRGLAIPQPPSRGVATLQEGEVNERGEVLRFPTAIEFAATELAAHNGSTRGLVGLHAVHHQSAGSGINVRQRVAATLLALLVLIEPVDAEQIGVDRRLARALAVATAAQGPAAGAANSQTGRDE